MVLSSQESKSTEEVKSPSEIVQLPPGLKVLQTKYFGEAIVNLITQQTPKEVILKRPGRGGSYDYVPIYWFVPQLNALFGFLWDVVVDDKGLVFEDVDVQIKDVPEDGKRQLGAATFHTETVNVPTQLWVQGHLNIKIPGQTITEKIYDKDTEKLISTIETKLDPIVVTKHAFGGTEIKNFKEGGLIDIGDDYKAAEADMLKKACSYLGMCADIYGKREIGGETGPSDIQMKSLLRKGAYLGGSEIAIKEKLDRMCEKEFECGLGDIDINQFIKLMKLLTEGARKPISHALPSTKP